MTTFPGSPPVLKGGIVLIDPESSAIQRVIVLQYNPDTLSRTLQPKTIQVASEGGDRVRRDAAQGSTRGNAQTGCRDRRHRPARAR